MATRLQILNLALGKLSPNRIVNDNPPKTALEAYMVNNYDVAWRNTELTKRRWVFATKFEVPLTLTATLDPEPSDYRKYQFALPNDCLRPIREKRTEWKQRGKFAYSSGNTLNLSYIANIPENDFDPLFVDVLASWIAIQACMYVTESNTKMQARREEYMQSVNFAKQVNAFIIGPEDIQSDDDDFSFLTARYV